MQCELPVEGRSFSANGGSAAAYHEMDSSGPMVEVADTQRRFELEARR